MPCRLRTGSRGPRSQKRRVGCNICHRLNSCRMRGRGQCRESPGLAGAVREEGSRAWRWPWRLHSDLVLALFVFSSLF